MTCLLAALQIGLGADYRKTGGVGNACAAKAATRHDRVCDTGKRNFALPGKKGPKCPLSAQMQIWAADKPKLRHKPPNLSKMTKL